VTSISRPRGWVGVHRVSLMLLALLTLSPAARGEERIAGYPAAEALRLGEAIYQAGILPSGQPVRALVQGDTELDGSMTTCANCHMRSGLGSAEGGIFTPPTSGAKLYGPLSGQQDIPGPNMSRSMYQSPPRPAYTDASLANALLYGVDPTGRKFGPTMPRYLLDRTSTELLLYYIKQLSSTVSPGVTATQIHFATVVSDQVDPREWDALFLPLAAFLEKEWNARLSVLGSQWNARWFGAGTTKPSGALNYRQATLEVWRLKGKPETWGAQLEELYRKKPVFAVLGGMVAGPWSPVHRFCETNKIPCILPVTDLPQVAEHDLYTLYFSKGYYQEGETAAKYLSRVFALPTGKELVQVYRENEPGLALSRGFADTWGKLGSTPLLERRLAPSDKGGTALWAELARKHPNAVLMLWLSADDLAGLEQLAAAPGRSATLFVSSTLLGGTFAALPDAVREVTFLTYPKRLPGDGEYTRQLVSAWLKTKKIATADLELSSRAYFSTRLLSSALIDMGVDYYRDFFLDLMDCAPDQVNSSLSYPVLSFGPGQRYASKGCYIVTLGKGEHPKLVRQSDWVIY